MQKSVVLCKQHIENTCAYYTYYYLDDIYINTALNLIFIIFKE